MGKQQFQAKLAVTTENGEREFSFKGRLAWTMVQLIDAGSHGVTPIERPAPRWSDYVFQLRNLGIDIETIREKHGGVFSGDHGRYVLHSDVRLIEVIDPAQASGRAA